MGVKHIFVQSYFVEYYEPKWLLGKGDFNNEFVTCSRS